MALTCTYCRTSIDPRDMFCPNCGRDASGSWPASEPPTGSAARINAAAGQATPNATYLGMGLLYNQRPEGTFDPLLNARYLVQFAVRAAIWAIFYLISYVVFSVLFLLIDPGGLLAAFDPGLASLMGVHLNGGGVLLMLLACAVDLALLLTFWLLKIPFQLSEWKFSVDGKGAAAPIVFGHISQVLRDRHIPLDSLQVRKLNLPGASGTRDYLELRSGLFYGYVGCFPYGQDLYVGWTFWVRISPLEYAWMSIKRTWESITNKGSDLYTSLRYDSARALRQSMHSAVREGIDVAAGQLAAVG
jgi:hypothetical protein